jgi:hypothetical protein
MLSCLVELGSYHRLRTTTIAMLGQGTVRAVKVALEEGADYGRRNHQHTRRTGALTSSDNLYSELAHVDARGAAGYLVNRTPYAGYVERGTRAHPIWPKEGYRLVGPLRAGQSRRTKTDIGTHRVALRFMVGGQIRFARMVNHPGSRAMPFMQPAADFCAEVIQRETENVTFVLAAALWE